MSNDVIKHILPYISATEPLIDYCIFLNLKFSCSLRTCTHPPCVIPARALEGHSARHRIPSCRQPRDGPETLRPCNLCSDILCLCLESLRFCRRMDALFLEALQSASPFEVLPLYVLLLGSTPCYFEYSSLLYALKLFKYHWLILLLFQMPSNLGLLFW